MSKIGDPAKLAVIVGTGYGYEREDGVAVVPITHLGAYRRVADPRHLRSISRPE
jgi:hypothetical protein